MQIPPSATGEAAVRALAGPAWTAAWLAGDAAAIADFYDPGAILFPNGQAPVDGRLAIESGYRDFLRDYRVTGASEILELDLAPAWAWLRGAYAIEVTRRAGGPPVEQDRGNFLWIVRRQEDGAWKIFRAFGASLPPAEA